MNFEEVLNQAIALLQRQGRVSYRALMRQFALDEGYLQDLKVELVEVLRLAFRISTWATSRSGGRTWSVAPQCTAPSCIMR